MAEGSCVIITHWPPNAPREKRIFFFTNRVSVKDTLGIPNIYINKGDKILINNYSLATVTCIRSNSPSLTGLPFPSMTTGAQERTRIRTHPHAHAPLVCTHLQPVDQGLELTEGLVACPTTRRDDHRVLQGGSLLHPHLRYNDGSAPHLHQPFSTIQYNTIQYNTLH